MQAMAAEGGWADWAEPVALWRSSAWGYSHQGSIEGSGAKKLQEPKYHYACKDPVFYDKGDGSLNKTFSVDMPP